MPFFVLLEQKAGGCDYSLACGKLFKQLEAKNYGEALAECDELLHYHGKDTDELSFMILIESQSIWHDMLFVIERKRAEELKKLEAEAEKKHKEYVEAAERAELARLKKKYEKNGDKP